jgi:hypothetical protein
VYVSIAWFLFSVVVSCEAVSGVVVVCDLAVRTIWKVELRRHDDVFVCFSFQQSGEGLLSFLVWASADGSCDELPGGEIAKDCSGRCKINGMAAATDQTVREPFPFLPKKAENLSSDFGIQQTEAKSFLYCK